MKVSMFAIYDKKANSFQSPFTAVSPGVAERMVREEMSEDALLMRRHSEDFQLWSLGSFDTESGNIEPNLSHLVACSALL